MMQLIRTVPRTTVSASMRALRLPVTIAERLTHQQDNESWAPALAFEKIEAKVETLAGSLLRDEELVEAGERRDAKLLKLKEAKALKAAADYEKTQAREAERERQAELSRKREQTNRVARDRKDAVKAKEAKQKQAAEAAASKRESAARAKEAAQQKVIDRQERAAKGEALRAESEALDITDEALQAQETVDLIDATLEGNKEARKTG